MIAHKNKTYFSIGRDTNIYKHGIAIVLDLSQKNKISVYFPLGGYQATRSSIWWPVRMNVTDSIIAVEVLTKK